MLTLVKGSTLSLGGWAPRTTPMSDETVRAQQWTTGSSASAAVRNHRRLVARQVPSSAAGVGPTSMTSKAANNGVTAIRSPVRSGIGGAASWYSYGPAPVRWNEQRAL